MSYYGIKVGKKPGVYDNWAEASEQVMGFSGAIYKKFETYDEAKSFIDGDISDIEKENNIESDYLIDPDDLKEGESVAYVDGSFNKDSNRYGYGVVYFNKQSSESIAGVGNDLNFLEMQSVGGELKGAIVAIELALYEGREKLYLHYDYLGIEMWAKGLWKTNKSGTKEYKDFIDKIKTKIEIEFIKVAAHTGIEYNEEADKLAKSLFK